MKTYLLERQQVIPLSKDKVFAFFSDAFNLERITPSFLKFKILTAPPIRMEAGTLIEYRLALFGMAFKWRTLIEAWTENEGFVDTQIRGPYAYWRHTHTFEDLGSNETLMRDVVCYRMPFGLLGRLAHWMFVGPLLKLIFDYRAATTANLLATANNFDRGKNLLVSELALGD